MTRTGEPPARETAVLPSPLATMKNPLRWGWNFVQQSAWTVLLAYLGMLFFVTVYYLLFEMNGTANLAWHRLVPSSDVRHLIRNVGEGLFGGLFARAVAWNHYRKTVRKPAGRADVTEQRLRIPNLKDNLPLAWWHPLSLLVFVPLYATPGFLIGLGIRYAYLHDIAGFHAGFGYVADTLRVHLSTNPQTAGFTDRVVAGLQSNWDQKLIGYLAAFLFGRRVASAVIDDVQLAVARRSVARAGGIPTGWAWRVSPPGYRARCTAATAAGVPVGASGSGHGWQIALRTGAVVAVMFVIAGEFILTVVAPG